MYIIRRMRSPMAWCAGAAAVAMLIAPACGGPLARQYEYEEQLYLTVNGGATIILDASIPALVALRGLPLDPKPTARIDRETVRRVFEEAGCEVVRVGQLWRRHGRRFVQVRLRATDVRTLASCRVLAWSSYAYERDEAGLHFEQRVGAAAGGDPGAVNWNGQEIVAFRLHLPSRILTHNVRRLTDGAPGETERGNILTYEQRFADRRAGKPIPIDVRIETQPILYRTLWLFGGSFAAALVALGLMIWLVVRRGKRLHGAAGGPAGPA
jgi:hypothetical protein